MLAFRGDTADHSDRVHDVPQNSAQPRILSVSSDLFLPRCSGQLLLTSNVSKQVNDDNSEYLVEKMLSMATVKLRENYDAVIMGIVISRSRSRWREGKRHLSLWATGSNTIHFFTMKNRKFF